MACRSNKNRIFYQNSPNDNGKMKGLPSLLLLASGAWLVLVLVPAEPASASNGFTAGINVSL